jgi:hypothetical protein
MSLTLATAAPAGTAGPPPSNQPGVGAESVRGPSHRLVSPAVWSITVVASFQQRCERYVSQLAHPCLGLVDSPAQSRHAHLDTFESSFLDQHQASGLQTVMLGEGVKFWINVLAQ